MKFKKVAWALIAFTFLAIGKAIAYLPPPPPHYEVVVDGKRINFAVNPFIEKGILVVPLRGVFEAMGASVEYSAPTGDVFVRAPRKYVEVAVGETEGYVNGVARPLGVPVQRNAGRVFVPLRFIAEALGAGVRWDNATRTVFIETRESLNGIAAGKVELRVAVDKKYYKSGEPVRFTLTAINGDDRPRNLIFRGGQSFDITVTSKTMDTLRWDWSHGRFFTLMIRNVTLRPGETMSFDAVWKQQSNQGSEMPRGDYLVQAKLTSEKAVAAAPFTIHLVD
jgi:hypothetical protein